MKLLNLSQKVHSVQLEYPLNINELKEAFTVKSVRIRSFSGLYLSVLSQNAGKYGPEKLRIRILFTQCFCLFKLTRALITLKSVSVLSKIVLDL